MNTNTKGPALSVKVETVGDKVNVKMERADGAVVTIDLTKRAALDLANRLILEALR
jgi:hypothetical protein